MNSFAGTTKILYKNSSSDNVLHYGGGLGFGFQKNNLRYYAGIALYNFNLKTAAPNTNNVVVAATLSNTFVELPLGITYQETTSTYPIAGVFIVPGYRFFSTFNEFGLKPGFLDDYNENRNRFNLSAAAKIGVGFKVNSLFCIELCGQTQYYLLSTYSKTKEQPWLIGGGVSLVYNLN